MPEVSFSTGQTPTAESRLALDGLASVDDRSTLEFSIGALIDIKIVNDLESIISPNTPKPSNSRRWRVEGLKAAVKVVVILRSESQSAFVSLLANTCTHYRRRSTEHPLRSVLTLLGSAALFGGGRGGEPLKPLQAVEVLEQLPTTDFFPPFDSSNRLPTVSPLLRFTTLNYAEILKASNGFFDGRFSPTGKRGNVSPVCLMVGATPRYVARY
ncbi:hypothetical protein H6P81_008787 [Aristolochia fimbriata]|uniref:Uncharacterized protein n=1 Tax=Aristolochia fimbriata TaxID=158543 RepID=A0AAV7EIZ8_ARIFI|nr:hypothetical protein H6P81_008787 [Aristolochia fimbriata]